MGETEKKLTPVKLLHREKAYQGVILTVYKDHVLANGHEADWDYSRRLNVLTGSWRRRPGTAARSWNTS